MTPTVEYWQYRWEQVKITPRVARAIARQIQRTERRDAGHRLCHHLHTVRVGNCPDCPRSGEVARG